MSHGILDLVFFRVDPRDNLDFFCPQALLFPHSPKHFLSLQELNLIFISIFRPFVRSKGRKFERARGRRASRGYKA